MTTTIDPDLYTVVVHFDVPPDQQRSFVDELAAAVEVSVATLPGFRTATFLTSDDGTRVMNIAQWDSAALYELARTQDISINSAVPDVVEGHSAHEAHLDGYQVAHARHG